MRAVAGKAMLYTVQAYVVVSNGPWRASIGLPTFLLDSEIQAIRDEAHASDIARRMLGSIAPADSEIHVSVAARD